MSTYLLRALALLALIGCNGNDKSTDTGGNVDPGTDADGDGYYAGEDEGEDCDDDNGDIYPGAIEDCDGVDNDCDGEIDDGQAQTSWYYDSDGDGYGDTAMEVLACGQPEGYVSVDGDCDDDNTSFHPNAEEDDCTDPTDYNCDGSVGYSDVDGDRYPACLECDDNNASTYPGAPETCNEVDDDCDGVIDDDATDASAWYIDYDTDGYGSTRYSELSCTQPEGYVDNADDCNDANDDAYPGGEEVCDGADNNCDGEVDEATATDASTWYGDSDGDGFGVEDSTTIACDQPDGYADNAEDCDDADALVNPDSDEICNGGTDDNCDGEADDEDAVGATTWYADGDGDGYGLEDFVQIACEQPDLYADNPDDCYDDGTSFGAGINPEGTEICDGFDNNCDGATDEDSAEDASTWYADNDGDGFGTDADTAQACDTPDGYIDDASDCDDEAPDVNPEANEICNDDIDNNCDDSATLCVMELSDADAVLYGDAANTNLATSVAAAGDVDGDGDADLIVGAPLYDSTVSNVGAAYVVPGPVAAGSAAISTASYQILGEGSGSTDDKAGQAVAGVGDLNSDGYDDLLVGAIRYTTSKKKQRGAEYVILGPVTSALSLATDYDHRYVGYTQFDRLGYGAAGGDVDGDGEIDLVMGANGYDGYGVTDTGATYVFLGPIAASSADTDASAADITLIGEFEDNEISAKLTAEGDLDGDGQADILVGDSQYDPGTDTNAGGVYIVMDPATGAALITDVAEIVYGESALDAAGVTASEGGDLNDDGYDDLVVGANGRDDSGEDAGAVYIVYGPVSGGSLSGAGTVYTGEGSGDALGGGVGAGGDNDGDGTDDLILGASAESTGGAGAGAAYLIHGPIAEGAFSVSVADAKMVGDDIGVGAGTAVLFAGDMDGSGNDDVVIGASDDDRGGSDAGAVFLINELGL